MVGRGDQHQFFAQHRLSHQVRIVDGQREQAEVGGAGTELLDEPRRGRGLHLDVDARMDAAELFQQPRKDVEAGGHSADQPDRAAEMLAALDEARPGLIDVG